MKIMLEQMYKLYNMEKEMSPVKPNIRKEQKICDALCNTLSQSQKEMFNQFIDQYAERHCENITTAYKDGFTAGALLMIEIFTAE